MAWRPALVSPLQLAQKIGPHLLERLWMINTCLLLECFSVWCPLYLTVLPGQELHMRRFFEQDSGDAGFFYRRADDAGAVIRPQERRGRSERCSHRLAEGRGPDQIARLCEPWQGGRKKGPFVIHRGYRFCHSRKGCGVRWVRVNDALHLGAPAID